MVFWETNRVGSHVAFMKASLSIFNLFYQIVFKVLDWTSNKIL